MDYLPKGRKNMLLRDEEFDTLESLCYRSNLFACQSKNVVTFEPKLGERLRVGERSSGMPDFPHFIKQ